MKKFLTSPIVKTALIALAVVVLYPRVRPYVQKIPVVGAWL